MTYRNASRGDSTLSRTSSVSLNAADDATRSFNTGTLQTVRNPPTIADGLRTPSLGKVTYPLVLKYVDDMLTVTDDELLKSMFFLWERMKIVVEPTGTLAACALLERKLDAKGKRVGVVLSGCALAAKHLNPGCRVIGVEPAAGDDATRSFRTKTLQTVKNPDTIADGARTPSLGKITYPLVMRYVDDMLTVTDDELLKSMFFLWERMKIVVEPTGALAACALLEKKLDAKGKRVGVVLSGGNVDLAWAARVLKPGLLRTD